MRPDSEDARVVASSEQSTPCGMSTGGRDGVCVCSTPAQPETSPPSLLPFSGGHTRPPPRLLENFYLREVARCDLICFINDGLWCCRCNLRCQYCMPSEGVTLTPNTQLLSQDEIIKIAQIFVSEGVKKVDIILSFLVSLQYPPVLT